MSTIGKGALRKRPFLLYPFIILKSPGLNSITLFNAVSNVVLFDNISRILGTCNALEVLESSKICKDCGLMEIRLLYKTF